MHLGLTMNPFEKALWVQALKSGELKQSHGALKKLLMEGTGYCCLGVFCAVQKLPERSTEEPGGLFSFIMDTCDGDEIEEDAQLDVGWFSQFFNFEPFRGLNKANALGYLQSQLIEFNDDKRKSFSYIADWIDNNL